MGVGEFPKKLHGVGLNLRHKIVLLRTASGKSAVRLAVQARVANLEDQET